MSSMLIWYAIYLLQLGFQQVAVVGRFVQKQERDSYIQKRNNTRNNENTEHTKEKTKHKKQEGKQKEH